MLNKHAETAYTKKLNIQILIILFSCEILKKLISSAKFMNAVKLQNSLSFDCIIFCQFIFKSGEMLKNWEHTRVIHYRSGMSLKFNVLSMKLW